MPCAWPTCSIPGGSPDSLRKCSDYHNFVLTGYFQQPAIDFAATHDALLAQGERIKPLVVDVTQELATCAAVAPTCCSKARKVRCSISITARSRHLPVRDLVQHHGRWCVDGYGPGAAEFRLCAGHREGLRHARCAGPFPTELFDATGEHLSRVGHEFGSVTGRARRCGWFDAVALRRSIIHSSVSGLCVTKLDVLDGLATIRICTAYRTGSTASVVPPLIVEGYGAVEPVYEDMPGWTESTVGLTRYEQLPLNAQRYLERIQEVVGVPVDIVSTGPDREQTIILNHPFA